MKNKWILIVLGLVLTTGAISGCNTSEGIGEDVENLGDEIKDI